MGIKKAIKAIAKKVFIKENVTTGMKLLLETIIADKKKGSQRERIRRK